MKKVFIIFLSLIILLVAVGLILPIVFKDDIKAAIDKDLATSVNADVVFDIDKFSLSLFSNFPNLTVGMGDFGVVNRAPFEGEILLAVNKFEVEVNLMSLFGNQMRLSGIYLNEPEINIKVLEDGTANYDIAVPSEEVVEEDTVAEATEFSFGIDHWEITNGHIVYDDQSIPFMLELKGLNHSGSGDFSQDLFDLATNTTVDTVNVAFDGTEYMSNKKLGIDMVISIAEEYTKFTFKENVISVNEFAFGFDGSFKMNEDSYDMDVTYSSKDNSFKSILSLVPGVFTEGFEDIKTNGNLSFGGAVKGTYSETQMPAFDLNLSVEDAMFQYPDLPSPVSNINVNMLVDNKDGVIENTRVDISKFHLDFGSNPFDAKLLIENLRDYKMDANIKAELNLSELATMFPVEGLEMRGLFNMDISANGVYDSISGTIPTIDAAMSLSNGFIKSSDFPVPLENMHFTSSIKNPSGKMADTKVVVDDFNLLMDGEQFSAALTFENLDNYTWDLFVKGGIDLEKMTKIFPLEGMTLAGKINADMRTRGNMADLDAERYAKLPTSGSMSISDFKYVDEELPYDVTISIAKASFDPAKISLDNYSGTIGKSDMSMSGQITNYIGYLFGENETLKGNLNFQSNLMDLNEFMAEEEESTETAEEDTTAMSVIPIPKDIDFTLNSSIKKMIMMDMEMTNVRGQVILKNGVANLKDLKFGMLDGQFVMNGSYDTEDVENPKYDFELDIQDLSIARSFETFSVVQEFAPIAKGMNGDMSTTMNIGGLLQQDMMPDMNSIKAGGLLKVAKGALSGSNFTSGLASFTKLNNAKGVTVKDVLVNFTIEDGKLNVKPFDISIGQYKTTVSGSSSFTGDLNYDLDMDLPAGVMGSKVTSLINKYSVINVGGTYDDPKYSLKTKEGSPSTSDMVKDAASTAVTEATGVDVEAEKEKQRQKIMADAKKQADRVKANAKKQADRTKKEGYAQADKLVKDAGSNPIKKRIAKEAAKKMRNETDKSVNKILQGADKQADKIMKNAEAKAAKI